MQALETVPGVWAEGLPGLMLERKLKLQLCNPNSYLKKKKSQNLYFYLEMFEGL